MYKMVSEYGNELKIVYSAIERNALISLGWHEDLPEVIQEPKAQSKPKEVKASGKTNRTGRNIW